MTSPRVGEGEEGLPGTTETPVPAPVPVDGTAIATDHDVVEGRGDIGIATASDGVGNGQAGVATSSATSTIDGAVAGKLNDLGINENENEFMQQKQSSPASTSTLASPPPPTTTMATIPGIKTTSPHDGHKSSSREAPTSASASASPTRSPSKRRRTPSPSPTKQHQDLMAETTMMETEPDQEKTATPNKRQKRRRSVGSQTIEPTDINPTPTSTPMTTTTTTTTSPQTKKKKKKPKKRQQKKPPKTWDPTNGSRIPATTDPASEEPETCANDRTWQDWEITVYDPDDPDDDGEGLSGVGFRASAMVEASRRFQQRMQVEEYQRRIGSEERERRKRKRDLGKGAGGDGDDDDDDEDGGGVVGGRKGVRFSTADDYYTYEHPTKESGDGDVDEGV